MKHLGFAAPCGSLVLRAALTAAIALPLAYPAVASTMLSRPLPLAARFGAAPAHAFSPAERLRQIQAKARKSKKAAHFSFPYGVASDAFGNVYVANFNNSSVSMIGSNLKVSSQVITQSVVSPISLAVDASGALFVGNTGGGGTGDVEKYVAGQPALQIAPNTGYPFSIAVDGFDDLYVTASGGIATDDVNGNAIFGPEYASYVITAVAAGNGSVYGFVAGNYLQGNGSYLLRTGTLQSITGPDGASNTVSATCGDGLCWYTDNGTDSLFVNNGSNVNGASLGYDPGGVTFDQQHNRVFVADPVNDAVHVYNAQTLAFEKTIT